VAHDQCTHKVGTDGVLLGSWVTISPEDRRMLDIGTGSGLISLMLAQRTAPQVTIDAIEIEKRDAAQAQRNVANSPWPSKVRIIAAAAQDFSPGIQYDLIVSNPPYFINSLLPPDTNRSRARHTHSLSFEELLNTVARLLRPTGRFALILPNAEGNGFIKLAEANKLYPIRKFTFRSRLIKPVERLLIEFSFNPIGLQEGEIILYSEGSEWTHEYRKLTGEFYLDF